MLISCHATDTAPKKYFERIPEDYRTLEAVWADALLLGCSTDWKRERSYLKYAVANEIPAYLLIETAGAHRRVPPECRRKFSHFFAADEAAAAAIATDNVCAPVTLVGSVMTQVVCPSDSAVSWLQGEKRRLGISEVVTWLSSGPEFESLEALIASLPDDTWGIVPALHPAKEKQPAEEELTALLAPLQAARRVIEPMRSDGKRFDSVELAIIAGRAVGTWSQATITAAANDCDVRLVRTGALWERFQRESPGATTYPGATLGLPVGASVDWSAHNESSAISIRRQLPDFDPQKIIEVLTNA